MKYSRLVDLYEALNTTSKRLEKTYMISEFLKKEKDIEQPILLIQGRIHPQWNRKEMGISTKLVMKAISTATGIPVKEVEEEWKNLGDLGDAASSLLKKKQQMSLFQEELTTEDLIKNLRKASESGGTGSTDIKIKIIAKILGTAKPDEARYIIRTVLEDMRTGANEGVLRDSIAWAYFREEAKIIYNDKEKSVVNDEDREKYNEIIEIVQNALDMTNDFGKIAATAKKSGLTGLKKITISIGKPIKLMLYPKASDIEEAFKAVGKPAAIEYKYDGFRVQIHKNNDEIRLFTRRLDEVTEQFPDVVDTIKKHVNARKIVLDAEIVGFDPQKNVYLPFQKISQRIKRKYGIGEMAKKFPVELNVFDIILLEDKTLINTGFMGRRAFIESTINEKDKKIMIAKQIITSSTDEASSFYKESLKKGFEGVMAKSLEGHYKPGRRVGHGVKLKPTMEELDLVITGAEWGTGKRANWLTSYKVSCYDENEELVEIGKVGSGLKELEEEGLTYSKMTDLISPLITAENGKEVTIRPEIIIEVNYEEIQQSPTYTSGYALRFPRVIRLRDDKGMDEIADINQIEMLYKKQ